MMKNLKNKTENISEIQHDQINKRKKRINTWLVGRWFLLLLRFWFWLKMKKKFRAKSWIIMMMIWNLNVAKNTGNIFLCCCCLDKHFLFIQRLKKYTFVMMMKFLIDVKTSQDFTSSYYYPLTSYSRFIHK